MILVISSIFGSRDTTWLKAQSIPSLSYTALASLYLYLSVNSLWSPLLILHQVTSPSSTFKLPIKVPFVTSPTSISKLLAVFMISLISGCSIGSPPPVMETARVPSLAISTMIEYRSESDASFVLSSSEQLQKSQLRLHLFVGIS